MTKGIDKKGFTIVETLVAITILMIAIAGPLVVASKGLFGAGLAKNQMAASYLAQESMEVVKNIRDNNLYQGSGWLTGISQCTRSSPCDGSAIDGSGQSPSIINCAGAPCPIYAEANGYGHVSGSNPVSPFTRHFYIHDALNTNNCASSDECGVTVEVYWSAGGVPYSVIMTSELTSSLR